MTDSLTRRQFIVGGAAFIMLGSSGVMSGCSLDGNANASGDGAASSDPIVMVWLPDNSASDMSAAREAVGAAIFAATGREAELLTTTDYNVAIEAIASGQANMAWLGGESYVQANAKSNSVQAAFVCSDSEGSLDGACYYSRICVRLEDADKYKDGDSYSIENIEGKAFSFVSATSTSGFAVPSAGIVNHFDLESSDVLLDSGSFFSEVLFGSSHVGSTLNLLSGDAEAAAFDDIDVDMYLDLVSGEPNEIGSIYKAKDDAEAPLDTVRGEQFVIIASTPVLNAPFCFNEETLTEEERTKIVEYFCSDAVANDPAIFVDPDDENARGLWEKSSEEIRLVEVDDAWYDPIREMDGK